MENAKKTEIIEHLERIRMVMARPVVSDEARKSVMSMLQDGLVVAALFGMPGVRENDIAGAADQWLLLANELLSLVE